MEFKYRNIHCIETITLCHWQYAMIKIMTTTCPYYIPTPVILVYYSDHSDSQIWRGSWSYREMVKINERHEIHPLELNLKPLIMISTTINQIGTTCFLHFYIQPLTDWPNGFEYLLVCLHLHLRAPNLLTSERGLFFKLSTLTASLSQCKCER